jgi:hypothetical protein
MPADNVVGGGVLMPEEADIATCKHVADVRLFSSLLPPPSIPRQKTGASRIVHLDLSCLIVII